MSEPDNGAASATEHDADVVVRARNWKKIAVYGGGGTLAVLLLGGVTAGVVALTRAPATPKAPVQAPHEVNIAAPAVAPPPSAPPAVVAAPRADDRDRLKREIELLEAQRRLLQKEKDELQRQKRELAARGGGLSGERKCVLSGDPARRRDELRACFGLDTLQQQGASAAQASSAAAASAASAVPAKPAPATLKPPAPAPAPALHQPAAHAPAGQH